MNERSYNGVTRDHVAQIRSGLGKFGISIPEGDDVEVKGPLGVQMRVIYDEPATTLTLAVIKKPPFVSSSQIFSVIESQAKGLMPQSRG